MLNILCTAASIKYIMKNPEQRTSSPKGYCNSPFVIKTNLEQKIQQKAKILKILHFVPKLD